MVAFSLIFRLRRCWIIFLWENNLTQLCLLPLSAGVQELESHVLVPGDLLILTGNKVLMPCDAVLIEGSCVVDEGMLTGIVLSPQLATSVAWPTLLATVVPTPPLPEWQRLAVKHCLLWDLPVSTNLTQSCCEWICGFKLKLFLCVKFDTIVSFWVFSISFLNKRLLQPSHLP